MAWASLPWHGETWGRRQKGGRGRVRRSKQPIWENCAFPFLRKMEPLPFIVPSGSFHTYPKLASFYVLAAGHSWRQKQWGGGLAGWETPFCRLVMCEQWGHGKVGLPHIPPGLSGSAEACTAHTACFFGDSGRWSKFFVPHPVKSFRLNLTENLPSSDLGCL